MLHVRLNLRLVSVLLEVVMLLSLPDEFLLMLIRGWKQRPYSNS